MKKYNLLTEIGNELKVSEDALTLLVDGKESADWGDALRRSAFAPMLFAELRKQYGESMPSDENLRAFLLKKGFLQSAVDAPIRAYRETIALVDSLPKADNNGKGSTEEPDTLTASLSIQGNAPQVFVSSNPKAEAVASSQQGKQVGSSIPVTQNCSMSIIASGEVTQEGLEKLVQYINLIKGSFPKTDETIQ